MKQWIAMIGLALAMSFGGTAFAANEPAPAAPAAPAPAAAAAPATTTAPTTRARGFRGRAQNVGLRGKFRSKFGRR